MRNFAQVGGRARFRCGVTKVGFLICSFEQLKEGFIGWILQISILLRIPGSRNFRNPWKRGKVVVDAPVLFAVECVFRPARQGNADAQLAQVNQAQFVKALVSGRERVYPPRGHKKLQLFELGVKRVVSFFEGGAGQWFSTRLERTPQRTAWPRNFETPSLRMNEVH